MIWIFLLLLITFLNYLIDNKISGLNFLFSIFWLLICIGNSFQLYGLYDVHERVYFIVFLGNLFLLLGNLFSMIFTRKRKKSTQNIIDLQLNKVFWVMLCLAIAIVVIKLSLMLPTIIQYGIGNARNIMQQNDDLNLSGIWSVLQVYFAFPFIRCAMILTSIKYVVTKNNKFLLLALLLSILQYFSDGGRSVIINFLICIIYIIINLYKAMSKKAKRNLTVAICVSIVVIAYSTIERKVNLFQNFYTYYCGSLVYFDKNIDNHYLFGDYLYGTNSLQGFLRPLYGVLNIFGINDPLFLVSADDFLMGVQNTVTYVSNNSRMNYFITCFGYFIKDFGIYGLVIFPFLLGVIFSKVNKSNEHDFYNLAIKILFTQGVFFTMSKFLFSDYNFVMALFYIILIKKIKIFKIKRSF